MEEKSNGPKIFTPAWFKALFAGDLILGETFWGGNFGTALFHQPIVALLLVLPISTAIPAAFWGLLTLYQLALTRAVILAKPGVPTPIGWKIAGIIITFGFGVMFAAFARSALALE
ncbi:hypothetical protein [Shimia sp. SDUM112013]|uniref:hypothetical protein n=1 Tax=Shimia sp. SDUM112013 TaxID=3136160 RepID=UPI0032EDA50A